MDFESFFDDCMACNSLCENFKSLSEIQGQGDCKDRINFEHQNNWDKEKKIRNKFWEENKLGFKGERNKKCLNTQCDCANKSNSKKDILDKIAHETKYEKKNIEIVKNSSILPWNPSYSSWSNSKSKKTCVSEDFRNSEHSNSDKLLTETILELKEKVEFLFKIFQDFGPRGLSDSCNEQPHLNFTGTTIGDFWHLFNINKRLCVAEKGIQKLTLILENILKDSNKRKSCSPNESSIFNEPLNFEDMTITQRINLIKSRNDFLFSLMRDFLKVRSVDELYSALDLYPKDYEMNQNSLKPDFEFMEENQPKDFNKEDLMETLKQLKTQFIEINGSTSQDVIEDLQTRNEKRGENVAKSYRNKLEVISEQAELALFNDNKYEDSNECRKKDVRHLKEKFSEVKEEHKEKDSNISEITARLLAQEAMLKSSLDKAHFEIFSKRNSSEQNLSLSQSHKLNLAIETPAEEENNGCTETSFDSSSSFSREENNNKMETKHPKRPMTVPGSHIRTSNTKGLIPEKSREKYSGTNNVKNKNKFLLNQKSCVRMA